MKFWGLLLIGGLLLVGCGEGGIFEDPEAKATRESQGTAYVSTIGYIETQSGTLSALQSTADSASLLGTQVAQLSAQNQALQSTLTSNQTFPTAPVVQAQTPPPGGTAAALPGQQPGTAGGSGFQTDPNLQSASTTGTSYVDSVTATGVRNSDGCAIDSVSVFDANEDEIYMVTTAVNVQPGMTFHTQWSSGGEVFFESDSWTAEKTFDEICIWYYVSGPFSEGAYTAELIADGQVASRRTFQVGTGTTDQGAIQETPTASQ